MQQREMAKRLYPKVYLVLYALLCLSWLIFDRSEIPGTFGMSADFALYGMPWVILVFGFLLVWAITAITCRAD